MDDFRESLEGYLARVTGAQRVEITELERLSGGAIQENWFLGAEFSDGSMTGIRELVLRTDSRSAVAVSLSRREEFAVLRVAHGAGVVVPEPLWLCEDESVIGKVFYIMRRVPGIAAGHRIVRDSSLGGDRRRLAETLGATLARLHSVTPPQPGLEFLPDPGPRPALHGIAEYRSYLDAMGEPHPVLEWGLTWCERHMPVPESVTLIHRDFRTGNYMVDEQGLTGVLDWEFAGWGDPLEDMGWLFAKAWRFGRTDLEVGGIATPEPFLRGYEAVSGRRVEREEIRYWEVMAHLRWAIIAIQQGDRHISGEEPSLELALTGRIPAELEMEILELTEGE